VSKQVYYETLIYLACAGGGERRDDPGLFGGLCGPLSPACIDIGEGIQGAEEKQADEQVTDAEYGHEDTQNFVSNKRIRE
jgi:hypothetical protein